MAKCILRKRQLSLHGCGLAFLLLCVAPGCVLTQTMQGLEGLSHDGPCKVASTWVPQLAETPDPTHNGAPVKGIAGRVYLFGEDMAHTVKDDGVLIVSLYDSRTLGEGKQAVPLEEWKFDKDSLKRLRRKDGFGWGYTVFLPWSTYKPDITCIRLRVRYEPAHGTPLFEESPDITLNRDIKINSQIGKAM